MLVENFGTAHLPTVTLASASLVLIILWPRLNRRIPGMIVALIAGTLATAIFNLPVVTIGSRFGGIPTGFPRMAIPEFRADLILPLLPSAITVALLAAIESLLSAVVADSMTGDRHDSSVELVAQGVANVVVPLFGGIPATGAIARTATNIRSGARTPVAGMIHALTLLVIVLVAAPLARFIPLATLAAVLLVVAYNMGEWREIRPILRLSGADIAVWWATFLLTVMADLTVAVEVGMVLASLLYIYRISETTTVSTVTDEYIEDGWLHILQDKHVPDYVTILRIHGPFLFGTTQKLIEATADLTPFAPIVVLRLRNMSALDATGLHAIESLADVYVIRPQAVDLRARSAGQPDRALKLYEHVGTDGSLHILKPGGAAKIDGAAGEYADATYPVISPGLVRVCNGVGRSKCA
jgi:SulP family sulfate permease